MTQVETLARYATRASFADLSAESRRQLPIHILDSLGCCIAALGADPIEACWQQVAEFGGVAHLRLSAEERRIRSTPRSGIPRSCVMSISWTTFWPQQKRATRPTISAWR